MNDWPHVSLGEAGVRLIDCDHRTPPTASDGYPYVAIPQMRAGRLDLTTARLITHEHYLDWTRKALPRVHDIVLSRRTNPGETAHVPPNSQFALGQNLVLMRSDGGRILPTFLRWLVRGPEWWEQVAKYINVGAVFDSLRLPDVPKFKVHLPSLPEQRAITDVLGSLDDKIELNRRLLASLEDLVRSHVRSATAHAIADGSSRSVTLGALVEHVKQGVRPRDAAGRPYVGLEDMPRGRIFVDEWRTGDAVQSQKWTFETGDVLFGKLRPYFKKVGVMPVAGVCSTDILVLRPLLPKLLPIAVAVLASDETIEFVSSASTGTRMPRTSWERLASWRLDLPSDEGLAGLDAAASPLLKLGSRLVLQSRDLASFRDALLPELLSGRLRVGEAHEQVDAAS